MTERFNAGADQTIYGASGVGPAETPSSLTALGVGQGSGQSANAQERNSMIGFEFPIRWDDISPNLARLDEKKRLEDLIDDLTIRDRDLEDFLNTNIVNGIVAGSNITIDRAAGVVTISAPNAVTATSGTWTPTVSNNGLSASGSYYQVGQLMTFYISVFFTGTAVSVNSIGISLPSGAYGDTHGSIQTFFWQTLSNVYAGTAFVTPTGQIQPYNVGTNGFMTGFATHWNGNSLSSTFMEIRGVIRKTA